MKKTLLYFLGTLIGLFLILTALDLKGDYAVEEIIWNANKRLSEAARNPEVVPDKVFVQIADQYQKVITQYPKSRHAPIAHIFLGRVQLAKKDYETAREKFNVICEKFPENQGICAEALSAIGSSYELQNNWPEALRVYEKLKANYPMSDLGLSVPLYIANHYLKSNQMTDAQGAFTVAVSYYNKMAADNAETAIGLKSLQLLSNCYLAQKKWTDAVNVMGRILLKYPSPNVAVPMVRAINAIVLTQIRDFDLAIQLYREFIDQNPKSPLDKTLSEMIKAFEDLKTKDIKVTPKTP